jgi:chromosome segregation ATPase
MGGKMRTLEHKVESLESLLGQFIVNTDIALRRLESEMQKFREEAEKDRKAFEERLQRYIEESERNRKVFQDEMREFQDEMRAFKDEMRVFKDEMLAFKDEMRAFKDEMRAFKDEMRAFKDEMKDFKDEMLEFKRRQEEENIRKNKEWSALAKKMGTIVEDLIAPALRPTLSKYFQCEVTMEGQRIFRRKNGEDYEIDAIAGCDDKIFMIEARSTPRVEDVKEIKKKSERFFEFFPEHNRKELIVIFGSITFPENVIKYATKQGIYVLAWREWQYMDILNFEEVLGLST